MVALGKPKSSKKSLIESELVCVNDRMPIIICIRVNFTVGTGGRNCGGLAVG